MIFNAERREAYITPRVLILTHGDTDGICAAAIAKTAYPDAKVEFIIASDLPSKLRDLVEYDRVFILDLRPNKEQREEVKRALAEASKTCRIVYIDHHPFPRGVTRRDLKACEAIIHRRNASTSELALEFFKPPPSHEFIAVLGAIGDYQEHTRRMRRLIKKYGARKCYPEAVVHLDQVLRIVDDSFRRRMIEELARGKWPHEVPLGKEQASRVLKQRRILENHIRKEVKKVCDRALFVGDVPFKACGFAADLLVELLGAEIGIASTRIGRHLRLSMRRRWESDVPVNAIMEECASAVGGVGGGHVGASGGKIPAQRLRDFLKLVKRHICAGKKA
jgi:RecJ-like exonuclease